MKLLGICAKTVLLIQFGTLRRLPRRVRPPTWHESTASSRTWVIELPSCPRYRFSFASCPECLHAVPSRTSAAHSTHALGVLQRWDSFPGVFRCSSRGYARPAPSRSCGRMLLSMRRLPPEKWLREDVRIQTACLSLAGGDKLRQAAHAYALARFSRRPSVPSPRTRRARPPLESFLTP